MSSYKQVLAVGDGVRIETCGSCERVHLHLGALSLHLDADTFLRLVQQMTVAGSALQGRRVGSNTTTALHS